MLAAARASALRHQAGSAPLPDSTAGSYKALADSMLRSGVVLQDVEDASDRFMAKMFDMREVFHVGCSIEESVTSFGHRLRHLLRNEGETGAPLGMDCLRPYYDIANLHRVFDRCTAIRLETLSRSFRASPTAISLFDMAMAGICHKPGFRSSSLGGASDSTTAGRVAHPTLSALLVAPSGIGKSHVLRNLVRLSKELAWPSGLLSGDDLPVCNAPMHMSLAGQRARQHGHYFFAPDEWMNAIFHQRRAKDAMVEQGGTSTSFKLTLPEALDLTSSVDGGGGQGLKADRTFTHPCSVCSTLALEKAMTHLYEGGSGCTLRWLKSLQTDVTCAGLGRDSHCEVALRYTQRKWQGILTSLWADGASVEAQYTPAAQVFESMHWAEATKIMAEFDGADRFVPAVRKMRDSVAKLAYHLHLDFKASSDEMYELMEAALVPEDSRRGVPPHRCVISEVDFLRAVHLWFSCVWQSTVCSSTSSWTTTSRCPPAHVGASRWHGQP